MCIFLLRKNNIYYYYNHKRGMWICDLRSHKIHLFEWSAIHQWYKRINVATFKQFEMQ